MLCYCTTTFLKYLSSKTLFFGARVSSIEFGSDSNTCQVALVHYFSYICYKLLSLMTQIQSLNTKKRGFFGSVPSDMSSLAHVIVSLEKVTEPICLRK